ncbi:transglycosylase-like protein with SLT domain [Pseudonocardia endophytica]|uniref:Transglycosylase-like protein with SLT domain n=1 Tax=Pseudonocardia endophytica TaxID=401976 RepID=A0A4R1HUM9_PSEEN|nr:transglycosylase-like protein with SLT domain [Pseudonocardia endophytica]
MPPTVAVPAAAPAGPSPNRPLPSPASAARRVGTSTVAAGAAFGVVASGAFAAVIPTTLDGHSTEAAASDAPATMLASQSTPLAMKPTSSSATGTFSPVSFADAPAAPGAAQVSNADLASAGKAGKIAQKIAAEQARAVAADQQRQAARSALDKKIAAGGLDGWIAEALDHMGMSQDFAPGLKRIILKESNGNPDAINNWDSNALAGNPSEGLMQVIPSTFKKYVHPDFADRDVTDPVANITAGVRYMIDRYGEDTLAAGGRSGSGGGYLGY